MFSSVVARGPDFIAGGSDLVALVQGIAALVDRLLIVEFVGLAALGFGWRDEALELDWRGWEGAGDERFDSDTSCFVAFVALGDSLGDGLFSL